MPKRWLQVKGDPSVREFLFEQERQVSLFDEKLDQLHQIVIRLAVTKGAFHIKAHYSSSQLTCWFYDDPFNYKVYVKEQVFKPSFIDSFPDLCYEGRLPAINHQGLTMVLDEFKRLRFSDEQIYLRAGSFNRINGIISMNFSCDGSHYIEHEDFFKNLKKFGAAENQ